MQARFFPERSIRNELFLTKVTENGARLWIRKIQPTEWQGAEPSWARFHQTPDERIWILAYVGGSAAANWLLELDTEGELTGIQKVPFDRPFHQFLTTSLRNGHAPSPFLDILGMQSTPMTLHYGRIENRSE